MGFWTQARGPGSYSLSKPAVAPVPVLWEPEEAEPALEGPSLDTGLGKSWVQLLPALPQG